MTMRTKPSASPTSVISSPSTTTGAQLQAYLSSPLTLREIVERINHGSRVGKWRTSKRKKKTRKACPRVERRSYTFEETGEELPYALFVPSATRGPMPLLLALHGYDYPYDWAMGLDSLLAVAEARGMLVVAPLGYSEYGWYGARDLSLAVGFREPAAAALERGECAFPGVDVRPGDGDDDPEWVVLEICDEDAGLELRIGVKRTLDDFDEDDDESDASDDDEDRYDEDDGFIVMDEEEEDHGDVSGDDEDQGDVSGDDDDQGEFSDDAPGVDDFDDDQDDDDGAPSAKRAKQA